ncbi:riboflavin transporter 2-like [Mytilus edulis]|uniref:riboflavin transporter 2-like n=1 Tax=Mytilus edulis TaxID=6550 RepID=UPI0039F04128
MGTDAFQCKEVNIIVYLLVVLFGIGSWVDINGMFVEIPVFVQHLPEGWKLPSYLSIITQMANIGPIFITVMYIVFKKHMWERVAVYTVLCTGAASCLFLSFFWKETTIIAGELHSTALLVLHFFLSLTDCTTSVLFLPFMATFKRQYMTSYFIGEGLSGLIPSVVALGQGVGQLTCKNVSIYNKTDNSTSFSVQPEYHSIRFTVEEFFYFLFTMLVISILSFTILNYTSYCKKEKVKHYDDSRKCEPMNGFELASDQNTSKLLPANDSDELVISSEQDSTCQYDQDSTRQHEQDSTRQHEQDSTCQYLTKKPNSQSVEITENILPEILTRGIFTYYLVIIAWVNCLSNGTLPALQSYSTLPNGNEAYHLAATMAKISNPVACFVSCFITVKFRNAISVLTFFGTALAGYIIYLAVESPNPAFDDTTVGTGVVVTVWVLVTFLLTFVKVSIAGVFRAEGKRALLWIGGISQVGSATGAVITFVFVNVFELFESAPPCHL